MEEKEKLTEEQWKEKLTPEQYRITREKGTEQAFTGKYYLNKEEGVYNCVCCGNPLFKSNAKFESGSGWPSFFEAVSEDSIKTAEDNSYGMRRIEIMCGKCDAHLGHLFDDGPNPTGLRYCVNSASLDFNKS